MATTKHVGIYGDLYQQYEHTSLVKAHLKCTTPIVMRMRIRDMRVSLTADLLTSLGEAVHQEYRIEYMHTDAEERR